MKLVRFYYTKIFAEKESEEMKNLKIESALNIKSIKELPQNSKSDVSFLEFTFFSGLNYSEKIAKIELEGKMILSFNSKEAKEILKNWKKKEIKEELKLTLFNGILNKTNVKSLELEEELNLPPHFRLPSLTLPKKE
ncbi:hypothetical protein CO037_02410 [Candidatus Pacearchaeota archaeon CG_4_9_14_0_2_um_filter_30_8]|nr:MAG: hypothetical protein CO037_02410 [Candidatus Pacearchaeota archaeon CG_4_9_14_0_2_um_filter_30_8]